MTRPFRPCRLQPGASWGVVAVALASGAVVAAQGTGVPALPDLDVAYISIAPAGNTVAPNARQPKPAREKTTATARVVNHGGAASGPFVYTWTLDGKKLAEGRHPGLEGGCRATAESREWLVGGRTVREAVLQAGTFTDLSCPLPAGKKDAAGRLLLRVAPETSGASEISFANNRREERVEGSRITVVTSRRVYNAWTEERGPAETFSFEDAVQQAVGRLGSRFERSRYSAAPNGVELALRVDTIRVLDDAEDPAALRSARPDGWDALLDVRAAPGNEQAALDEGLLRELTAQLGVPDLEVLAIEPSANHVRDPETGEAAGIGRRAPAAPVGGPAEALLPEPTVLALNRLRSRRGRTGPVLYDLPLTTRLRVLDNEGKPIPGAEVTAFQARAGTVPNEPTFRFTTDAEGLVTLPNREAEGDMARANPFGRLEADGRNGLFLLRLHARGESEYQWLPITRLNLAFWHGETGSATLDLPTRLRSERSPAAPTGLTAVRRAEGARAAVLLTWTPPADGKPAGYFIYRGAHPTYELEQVGSVTSLQHSLTDPANGEQLPNGGLRYAVTAVDLEGRESGLGKPVYVAPR